MQDDKTKLNNLDKVVDGLEQSTAARKLLMDAELSMSINLIKFVRKEAPTFEKDISFAIAPLQKVVKLEESELTSEIRLAEDLNDIVVRKRVITRLEQEQKSAADAYKQSKLDFENAKHLLQMEYNKKSTGKQLEYAEDKYKQAKTARIDALEKLRASTQKLLVEKYSIHCASPVAYSYSHRHNEKSDRKLTPYGRAYVRIYV
ncbi:hypothetical protein TVAG_225170 [Trichomonas vaginalis G3]|uniref:Uncharacterized protein n=1 Tax=Trichomonas vaginalis (strain ATCC PRA-98 / G3) TaxID=412133 RepID=A2GBU3_TRIV3|nr:hypothetical protein TVAG_225170 [Trichomonas vaginalis G3]|eukprot:XP_001298306.1 hypothetical protein [Trichomonas vaginalis G3]